MIGKPVSEPDQGIARHDGVLKTLNFRREHSVKLGLDESRRVVQEEMLWVYLSDEADEVRNCVLLDAGVITRYSDQARRSRHGFVRLLQLLPVDGVANPPFRLIAVIDCVEQVGSSLLAELLFEPR